MLVHSCSWGITGERLTEILARSGYSQQANKMARNWIGYGVPDISRVFECTAQRVTLLGFGELKDGEAHAFELPIPPSLNAVPQKRRLTVTLAWLPSIASKTQKYRGSSLWFETSAISVVSNRREACSGSDGRYAVKRGTVQHEIFEGSRIETVTEGDKTIIQVNCKKEALKTTNPIPYGLIVTLEISERLDLPIYDEVRARITPAIQIAQI